MTHNARLVPFDISHIPLMDLDGEKIDEMFAMPEGIANLEAACRHGEAFTLIHEGRILGSGGIVQIWPGMGQAWVIPSRYVNDNPVTFARCVRRMLDNMMDTAPYHRVQAIVSTQLRPGERWIEMLGFTKEGLMVKYGSTGIDYWMYARVK